jgi:Domain of unknown function (DUF5047)
MRSTTGDFLQTLRESHLVDAELELYFPDAPGTPVPVPVLAGTIRIDRTSQIRRSGSVQMPWTVGASDELGVDIRTLPLGGYAIPKRGVRYQDGTRELVSLGLLRCEAVTWSEVEQIATIELADRMAQVRDESFQTPYVATGKRVAIAAKEIVEEVFGGTISYDVRFDPPTILQDVTYADSRLTAVFELARAAGAETYFDADGDWIFDIAAGREAFVLFGNISHGSAVVTGLSSTADLRVGMTVTGEGVPAGRKIAAINSSSQVTLDGPIYLSITKEVYGKNTWREVHVSETDELSPGMAMTKISGALGLQSGTTLVAITRPGENGVIKLSKPLTHDGTSPVSFTAPGGSTELLFAGAASAYPVWTVDTGETGVMLDASESLGRTSTFNGVLVSGQANAKSPAFSVLVTDSDPGSPTLWGGPFGKVLRVERSSAVQTVDDATATATAMLNEGLGLARSLTITAAPNPALEAGDTIGVEFADGRSEVHIVDSLDVSLGTEAIRLATRTTSRPGVEAFTPLAAKRSVFTGSDVWAQLRERLLVERVRERAPR